RRSRVIAVIRRFDALTSTVLPPIVAARVALLKDLAADRDPPDVVVARHTASTGLNALALFAPPASRSRQTATIDGSIEDVLEILRLCQNADDERTVLTEVCARLRRQLHAAAAGFFARQGGQLTPIVCDGRGLEPAIAERATAAGIPIAPHRCDDRIEAAAPVTHGGATIGAVVVRWTLGSMCDLSNATAALSSAAAAAGPMLAAELAHAAHPAAANGGDLVGANAAIGEVRRAIECAARAPFSILIEGESG